MSSPSDFFLKELRNKWKNLPIPVPEAVYLSGQELKRLSQMNRDRDMREHCGNLLTRLHSAGSGVSSNAKHEGAMAHWYLHQDESFRPRWACNDGVLLEDEQLIWAAGAPQILENIVSAWKPDGELCCNIGYGADEGTEPSDFRMRFAEDSVSLRVRSRRRHDRSHRYRLPAKLRRRIKGWKAEFSMALQDM